MTTNITRRAALSQLAAASMFASPALAGESEKKDTSTGEKPIADSADSSMGGGVNTIDGVTVATRTSFSPPPLPPLKEKVPLLRIQGKLILSRLILDGNWMGGLVYSRDLAYVSSLLKAYLTPEKIFETFYLAEQCGINTFMGNVEFADMLTAYWKWSRGKLQFLAGCSADSILKALDSGAVSCYVQSEETEELVSQGRFDRLAAAMEQGRKNGKLVGVAAQRIETIESIAQKGILPDYWVKTFHPINYWSAKAVTENNNIFCRNPERTREFMEKCPVPWIATQVTGSGSMSTNEGFRFALDAGADCLCMGMLDYETVPYTNNLTGLLAASTTRKRPETAESVDRKQLRKENRLKEKEERAQRE